MRDMGPKVTVNSYGPGRNLMLRWTDPLTGERKAKSAGTTSRKEAERKAGELEKKLATGKAATGGRISWQDFTWRVTDEHLPGQAQKTIDQTLTVFRMVERLLKPKQLGDLTPNRLSLMVAKLRKERKAEASIVSYMATLRPTLEWAVKMNLLPAVPAFPELKREKKRLRAKAMKGRPIEPEEFQRMIAAVPKIVGEKAAPSWQFYLRGLWWSGLRLKESLNLYWDRTDKLCVDTTGEHPMIWIPGEEQKSGEDQLHPMAPEFAKMLEAVPVMDRHGPVFKLETISGARGATDTRHPVWVSQIVTRIGEAAKVVVGERVTAAKDGSPKRVVKYASAHDLRRSFGERWAQRLFPVDLQALMRHKDISTTMRFYVGKNAQRAAKTVWQAYERDLADGLGSNPGNSPGNNVGNTFGNTSPSVGESKKQSLA